MSFSVTTVLWQRSAITPTKKISPCLQKIPETSGWRVKGIICTKRNLIKKREKHTHTLLCGFIFFIKI